MKRTLTLFAALVLLAVGAAAQKLSYSAVVRNSANELVANQTLTVVVSIANSNGGPAVYSETHSGVQTNQNGLLTLVIGDGGSQAGSMSDVTWSTAYITSDYTMPDGAHVTNTVPVTAVPYALSAGDVEGGSNQVNDGTLTIQKNGVPVGTFTADQAGNTTVNITITPQDIINAVGEMTPEQKSQLCQALNCGGGTPTPPEPTPDCPTLGATNVDLPMTMDAEMLIETAVNDYDASLIQSGRYTITYTGGNPITLQASFDANDQIMYATISNAELILLYGNELTIKPYLTLKGECSSTTDVPGEPVVYTPYDPNPQLVFKPTVTTAAATAITATGATCGGNVTDDGNATVTARGVCWSTTSIEPTLSDYHTTDGAGTGTFTSNLASLTSGTTYFVRAYATNSEGTAYGSTISFTTEEPAPVSYEGQPCPDAPTMTDNSGNTYETLLLGTQCWTKTNLRTKKDKNGNDFTSTSISASVPYYYIPTSNNWLSSDLPFTSYNASVFGYYYNWEAAKVACPSGWHLPSEADWTALTTYLSTKSEYLCGSYNAKGLASSEYWYTNNPSSLYSCRVNYDLSTNNATGFSAIPAGNYYSSYNNNEGVALAGSSAYFWTSSEAAGTNAGSAAARRISYDDVNLMSEISEQGGMNPARGLSVRCLKGEPGEDYSTVVTKPVTNIAQTSVTLNGEVTEDGGATVTARGFCWGTSENPVVNTNFPNSYSTDGTGTGTFSHALTGLTVGTTYHVRAYAKNSMGTAYGEDLTFTTATYALPTGDAQPCPNTPTVTDIDGNSYPTVQIGNQCWMAENLRTTKFANDVVISTDFTASATTPYCKKIIHNLDNYECLYNWAAVLGGAASSDANPSNVQGICPDGWHVPSAAEWAQLRDYMSDQPGYLCNNIIGTIGKALASTTGWSSSNYQYAVGNNQSANNISAFTATPDGYYYNNSFAGQGTKARFWSCSPRAGYPEDAMCAEVSYDEAGFREDASYFKTAGLAVRCLKGQGVAPSIVAKPTVSTGTPSDVTITSAQCTGQIISDGGLAVTACGLAWSTSSVNSLSERTTGQPDNTGAFSATLTDLLPATTYHVRAYATNSEGTSYGEDRTFTTAAPTLPMVTTDEVTNITGTTAVSGGEVTHEGASEVIKHGVCWGTSHNPTLDDHYTEANGGGSFASNMMNLTPGTTYYVRAYATNSNGTGYGNEVSFTTTFTCGTDKMVDADNNQYETVEIGTQCWTKTNLHVVVGTLGETQDNATEARYFVWPEKDAATYGYYYNWPAAMQACPPGWRLPSKDDWETLVSYAESRTDWQCNQNPAAGRALAAKTGWIESDEQCTVGFSLQFNDKSGFSAYPAASWYSIAEGEVAWFWSSTVNPQEIETAFIPRLANDRSDVTTYYGYKKDAYSVRCLKGEASEGGSTSTPVDGLPCPGTATVRDNDPTPNTYTTVQIGAQCWMAENLRSTRYADGTPIAVGTDTSSTTAYRYAPGNNPVATYGYLYNWTAVTRGVSSSASNPIVQGICPSGWHVPSDAEWTELTNYVGAHYACGTNSSNDAKALASKNGWNPSDVTCAVGNTPENNNETGFGALPAGVYDHHGYRNSGNWATFWGAATEASSGDTWACALDYHFANVTSGVINKGIGYSVRCLKGEASGGGSTPTTGDGQPCPGTATVQDNDPTPNTYNTVQIGNQCWMAENLRSTRYADGTPIAEGTDVSETIPYRYAPGNNPVATYGYLYNWAAVMHGASSSSANPSNVQGICPTGWHVPSDAEWTQLQEYVGAHYACGTNSSTAIAKALASTTGWNNSTGGECVPGNQTAYTNNASGFSALPAGGYIQINPTNYDYDYSGYHADFWSATESASGYAMYRDLYYNSAYVDSDEGIRIDGGYSVRCLKGEASGGGETPTTECPTLGAADVTLTNGVLFATTPINGTYDNSVEFHYDITWLDDDNHTHAATANYVETENNVLTLGPNGFALSNISDDLSGKTITVVPSCTCNVAAGETVEFGTGATVTVPAATTFECGTSTVEDHQHNVYHTVKIGTQCWTKENMRCTTSPRTGTYIVNKTSTEYATYTGKMAKWYDNDSVAAVTADYGLLYNWNAAVDTFNTAYEETDVNTSSNYAFSVTFTGHRRGICPTGWHVPSDAEWTDLTNYLDSCRNEAGQYKYRCNQVEKYIAKALSSGTGWRENGSSASAPCELRYEPATTNNASGFSALPASRYYINGCSGIYSDAYFWSATQGSSGSAFPRLWGYYDAKVYRTSYFKVAGFSVRCLKD
ncbi:MAG: hypothetical protein K5885_03130 [Bacteroidales bacterium]|nr:hypothetical protein [Bacteroidales bacterium]